MDSDGVAHENAVKLLRDKIPDIISGHEKFNYDFYLYLWLKGHKFNLNSTEAAIRKSMEWRHENGFLTPNDEYPPGYMEKFAFRVGQAADGSPFVFVNAGRQDWKAGMKTYGKSMWLHCWLKQLLRLEQILFDFNKNKQLTLGKFPLNAVFQFNACLNAKDFSMMQLTSLDMLKFAVDVARGLTSYFPSMLALVVYINMNKVFKVLFSATAPFLSSSMTLEPYGTNEEEWRPRLLNLLGEDELNQLLEV